MKGRRERREGGRGARPHPPPPSRPITHTGVGERNYRYFLAWLSFTGSMLLYFAVLLGLTLYAKIERDDLFNARFVHPVTREVIYPSKLQVRS